MIRTLRREARRGGDWGRGDGDGGEGEHLPAITSSTEHIVRTITLAYAVFQWATVLAVFGTCIRAVKTCIWKKRCVQFSHGANDAVPQPGA